MKKREDRQKEKKKKKNEVTDACDQSVCLCSPVFSSVLIGCLVFAEVSVFCGFQRLLLLLLLLSSMLFFSLSFFF